MSDRPLWRPILVMVIDTLGYSLHKASQVYLVEQSICRASWNAKNPSNIKPIGKVDEFMCASVSLQTRIAIFSSTLNLLAILIGFVVGPMYIRLAAGKDKRKLLLMNLMSCVARMAWYSYVFRFHLNPNWVLVSCFFDVIGGGTSVREVLLWLYVVKGAPEYRLTSAAVTRLQAVLLMIMSLGTFAGLKLLDPHIWLLCLLFTIVYVVATLIVYMLPQHGYQSVPEDDSDNGDNRVAVSNREHTHMAASFPLMITTMTAGNNNGQEFIPHWLSIPGAISSSFRYSLQVARDVCADQSSKRILLFFFLRSFGISVSTVMQQWSARVYDWMIPDALKPAVLEMFVSALVLVGIPLVIQPILRLRLKTETRVNFAVILISLLVYILGAGVMTQASTMTFFMVGIGVFGGGIGANESLYSLATRILANDSAIGKLCLGIRTAQALGELFGTVLWTLIFVLQVQILLPRNTLYGAVTLVFIAAFVLMFPLVKYANR